MSNLLQTAAVVLLWFSLGTLVYVYVAYPLLLAVIGFFSMRPKAAPGYLPKISMLIAAYNEEASIRKKIEDTLSLDYPADKMEILVLSDYSTDRTDEIVKGVADPRVRLLRAPIRRGIGWFSKTVRLLTRKQQSHREKSFRCVSAS